MKLYVNILSVFLVVTHFYCTISLDENLITVRQSKPWNTLIENGGFEVDKPAVISNRGSLLNVLPSSWTYSHGVSLISYKSFPKYLQVIILK